MQGTAVKILEYMAGSQKRFVIPVYQRNYEWKAENCKQLFDDLIKMKKQKRKSHFFGCIVSVYDADAIDEEYLIIDGQQRLTTISLLLLALHNLLDSGDLISEDSMLSLKIQEEYLIDKWKSKETRIKLKPVKNDQKALQKLFEDESEHIKDSKLTSNYEYFCKRLKEGVLSADEMFDALRRLEIIHIKLKVPDDDPQLIFESLNSTGLALSEGDKIRNFILMGLDNATQEEFYENYWNIIEECTRYDVSAFVRDFLSIKQMTTPVISRTYFAFKDYVLEKWGDRSRVSMEAMLKELLMYARHYQRLLCGGTTSKSLDGCIFRLNWLETTVCRPFLLEVLRLYYQEKVLDMASVEKIFAIVESFVFRRSICDVPTNALNKIFVSLHKDVMRFDGTAENYVEKLKYALSARRESGRFPTDAEFGEVFITKPAYPMKVKNKTYLLERLENYGTAEVKDVWNLIAEDVYSIEHIMPQALTPEWRRQLGERADDIHAEWLDRIANLTLTAYNSRYSNRSFREKRDMENGYRQSGLRMNQDIAQNEVWGEAELKARSERLRQRALTIWPYVDTDFRPAEKLLDSCTLADEIDLTGRQIASFRWQGRDYPAVTWADMYQQMVKHLHEEDPSVLARVMATGPVEPLAAYLAESRPDDRNWAEVARGIWLLTHMDTRQKLIRLRRFFELFDKDAEELMFFIKDVAEKGHPEEPRRRAIRREYWSGALEAIHAMHGDEASFRNVVTATSRNWIQGSVGYSGIVICCVANQGDSRVELYIGTTQKALNKEIFDKLNAHRAEIECELGTSLVWERRDERKSSKLHLALDGVDVYDEADWPRMAEFHAKWSRRFYDVFVPYLREILGPQA